MAFCNRSKFANAVFGRELHRRLTEAGSPVRSVLAHPGYTATGLQTKASGPAKVVFGYIGNPLFAQRPAPSAQRPAPGALSQLYAATDPAVEGGGFVGPGGPAELRGDPTRVRLSAAAADPETGRRLWELSERLTGVRFPVAAAGQRSPPDGDRPPRRHTAVRGGRSTAVRRGRVRGGPVEGRPEGVSRR